MEKIEYRAVIKFFTKEGKNAEIHDRLVAVNNDTALSYATLTLCHKEFRHGRDSLEDDIRVGRTSEACGGNDHGGSLVPRWMRLREFVCDVIFLPGNYSLKKRGCDTSNE
ncbi:hypothetical protein O3P69_019026 [Scylla paramamosain]|uniref:Mos1 transposase HTH domain-containing protein n=1 Tax=Scylla paramamosain TaxID=85552 RepID=A0AAW0T7Z3_SCYPA